MVRSLPAVLLLVGCSAAPKPGPDTADTAPADTAAGADTADTAAGTADTAADTDTAGPDTAADTGDTAEPDTASDTADTGPDDTTRDVDVSAAAATIRGLRDDGGARPIAAPGDLDGDGLADVVVASVAPDPGTDSMAYVFARPAGVLEVTDAYAARVSDTGHTLLALSLRAVGDLTGGGTATLAVASPEDGGRLLFWEAPLRGDTAGASTTTAAVVYADATSELLIPGDYIGPGDIDGDGADDLVVSVGDATSYGDHPETTWLLHGPFAGVTDVTAAATTITASTVDHLGDAASLAALGDTDGDGLADFALCDTFDRRAYVYADLPAGAVDRRADAAGAVEIEIQATLVEGLPDVDGDGYDDLAVGAWASDPAGRVQAGRVVIHRGPLVGDHAEADAWAVWLGDRDFRMLGRAIAGLGDTDGDGRGDVLLGSLDGAWLVTGLTSGTFAASDATARFTDGSGVLSVGRYVAPAGDTDGDGLADLLVHAWDPRGSRTEVYLFPGGGW